MSIRVTVWNEYRHEKSNPEVAKIYPNGLHAVVADAVKDEDTEVRLAALDDPQQALIRADGKAFHVEGGEAFLTALEGWLYE